MKKQIFKTKEEGTQYFYKFFNKLSKKAFLKEVTYEIEALFGCDLETANERANKLYIYFKNS